MNALSGMFCAAPVERLGWTLLHSVWQFAVIAFILWAMSLLLKRRSANLRYALSCATLAAMVAASGLTFQLLPDAPHPTRPSQPTPSLAAIETPAPVLTSVAEREPNRQPSSTILATVPEPTPPPVSSPADDPPVPLRVSLQELVEPWTPWVCMLWIGGVIVLSLRNLGGWIGVQRLRHVGTTPVKAELLLAARSLAARMKIRSPVRILQSAVIKVPIVIGWIKPLILLPVNILGELSSEQLDAILAHELAHIRRHDYLVNLFQTVLETLFFYHPAIWWVSRRIRIEREHCCDDAAVGICGSKLGLGEALTLIAAARLKIGPALAASGGRRSGVLCRVRRLLDSKAEPAGFSKAWAAAIALVLLGFALTAGLSRLATAESDVGYSEQAETSERVKGQDGTPAAFGSIAGRVVDAQNTPVAGVNIILGCRPTGLWLAQDALRPICEKAAAGKPPLHTITDQKGQFVFKKIPVGEYRVVAQSWQGGPLADGVWKTGGKILELRGFVDRVRVSPDSPSEVLIRPLGSGVLQIDDNVPKDGALMAISTQPLAADPILGLSGWFGPFMNNVIAWSVKPKGPMTIRGLPEGKLHVALSGFFADDQTGFGAADARIIAGSTTKLSIAVDSRQAPAPIPPPRLLPIVEEFRGLEHPKAFIGQVMRTNKITWPQAGNAASLWTYYREMSEHLHTKVALPSGRTAEFGDVMAVAMYLSIAEQRGPAWGKSVEGVRCRLRPAKSTWKTGETPLILADLQNWNWRRPGVSLGLYPSSWDIQCDGVWYSATARLSGTVERLYLKPGDQKEGISLLLDDRFEWKSKEDNRPLVFQPGKHTLLAAFRLQTADAGALRIESNLVEIEIRPEEPADASDTPIGKALLAGRDIKNPPTHIKGRVTDSDGKPIAGALVEWGYINDPPEKWQRTTSDAEGRYRIEIKSYGVSYRLGISAPGKAPQWNVFFPGWNHVGDLRISDRQAIPPETADFKLEPAHRIEGIVVDSEDKPIAGVKIQARTAVEGFHSSFCMPSQPMLIPGKENVAVTSGPDGRFVIDGLPAKHVELQCRAPDRHVNDQNYAVDKPCRIVMSGSGRPGIIRGRVIDQKTKKPVTEFTVTQRYEGKPQSFHSADGRFQWKGEATERSHYSMHVYSKDYAPAVANIEALPLGSNDAETIELWPGQPFLGQVVDAANGKPLANVPVIYGVVDYRGESFNYMDWPDRERYADGHHCFSRVQRVVTDDKGEFWFSEGERIRGTLFVLAAGYERLVLKPKDRPSATDGHSAQIKLYPEASISGVLLKEGRPLPGMEMSVWRQKPQTNPEEWFERTTTDAQGRFRFGSLGPGVYGVAYSTRPSRDTIVPKRIETVTLGRSEQKVLEPFDISSPLADSAEAATKDHPAMLSQTATLKVIVDIPGAMQGNEKALTRNLWLDAEAVGIQLRLESMGTGTTDKKDARDSSRLGNATNPGEVIFKDLSPGTYDFSRPKLLYLGQAGHTFFCDRQQLTFQPGETKTIHLVRKRGQRVGGAIHGLPKDVPGAYITVRSADATGDPTRLLDERKLPIYDALTCENDAKFLTALLEPGQYKIVAHAYQPETKETADYLGWRSPAFVGTALVTIEDDDPANPKKPAPHVTIELKPIERRAQSKAKTGADVLAGIRNVLPKGWQCSMVSESGKMGHPHGLGEPQFRLDFTNPTVTFADSRPNDPNHRSHPYLRLHFHPIKDKQAILKTIDAETMYSWDIPTYYAETKDYLIVDSPAWTDGGNHSEEAQQLMKPLEQTLAKHFSREKQDIQKDWGPDAAVGQWSKPFNGLTGRLVAPQRKTTMSGFIAVNLELKNVGESPVSVMVDNPTPLSVELKDAAGKPVKSTMQRLDVISRNNWITLAPGKSTSFKVSSNQNAGDVRGAHLDFLTELWKLTPGKYSLQATYSSKRFGNSRRPDIQWNGDISLPAIDVEVSDDTPKPTVPQPVLPPGVTWPLPSEKIDAAEVRRKIAALAVIDETVPPNDRPPAWLSLRSRRIVPQLIVGLNDSNPRIAEQCLQILNAVQPTKELTDALIAKAADERSPLRRQILCQLEKSAADPRVIQLLDRASAQEQQFPEPLLRARWASLAGQKDRAVGILETLLQKTDSNSCDYMYIEAIQLLGKIGGPKSVPILESVAKGSNWELAARAYLALAEIDPAHHALTKDQRSFCQETMCHFKEDEESFIKRIKRFAVVNAAEIRPFVMQMLQDRGYLSRRTSLLILSAWKDKEAVPGLRTILRNKYSPCRYDVITAYLTIDGTTQSEDDVVGMISEFGNFDNEVVLRGVVAADIPVERRLAILQRARNITKAPYLVPNALRHETRDIDKLLVGLMADETNLQTLAGYCGIAAGDKQKRFGPQIRRAFDLLLIEPTVSADGESVSQEAAEAAPAILTAVAAYELKEVAADVERLTRSKSPAIRAAAQAAGVKLGVSGSLSGLLARLADKDPMTRQSTAHALAQIQSGDESVRAAIEDAALAQLGKPSEDFAMGLLVRFGGPKSIKALLPILDDANPQRAVHAAWVLAQMRDPAAAEKAIRRVAIFGLFNRQLYQQGSGVDFQIPPDITFHQVTMRLNPGVDSHDGPVRIPDNLLHPFPWTEAEQQYAVRCYRLIEDAGGVQQLGVHFLSESLLGPNRATALDKSHLPLLREIAAHDSNIKPLMIQNKPLAHFSYRQLAAKYIAAITKEKATYLGLAGETLDSNAFPKAYKNQNQLLAKFFLDQVQRAPLPEKPGPGSDWRQLDPLRSKARHLREFFGPPVIEAIIREAAERNIDVKQVLPNDIPLAPSP